MKLPKLLFGYFLLVSCSKEKLPPDIQKSLNQTTNYIEQFKMSHAALPTRDEYLAWWKTNNLVGVVDYQITNSDYSVYIWLGERLATYSSKDKKTRDSKN